MIDALARFGLPPSSPFKVEPTSDEVEFFRENGFLAVDRLTTDEELEWLREVYRACFEPGGEAACRTRWDEESDVHGTTITTRAQAFFPELDIPQLLGTAHRRNGLRYAAALMGVTPADLTSWSHMLDKPSGVGRPTYWHQDEAYWEPMVEHHAVGVWMPLEDCPVEAGCMQFIPGSHLGGLREHYSRRPDIRPDLYEVGEPVDDSAAFACPLPAGGATFHHARTLHYTAPNTTGHHRRAYAIEFETRPTRRASPLHKPWVDATREILGAPESLRYVADGEYRDI